MKYLYFKNVDEFDPTTMLTFGMSVKNSENPIGMFGTGFKYAVAVLIRNGFTFSVTSHGKEYNFTTEKKIVRDKEFSIIHMNGEPANFTTELGKFWKPWMAIRELASNALDEGGVWGKCSKVSKNKNETMILVSGPGLEELWHESNSIFLSTKPIMENETASIHEGKSNWIYYRGIRAYELPRPTMYTYNILCQTSLTEDRTIKFQSDIDFALAKSINELTNKEMLMRIICAGEEYFENNLGWSYLHKPSDLLTEVVSELVHQFKHVPHSLKEKCHASTLKILADKQPLVLDKLDKQRLELAIDFCKQIGFPVDEYQIVPTAFLGQHVLGRAANGKIYLSKKVFDQGTKMLVGTLIEEYLHLAEQVDDCTRSMQNLLIDNICSLGERVTGKIL